MDNEINELLKITLEKAKEIYSPNYFRAGQMRDKLMDTYHNGQERGLTTHYQALDPHLTVKPGFVYCFTGYPGSGKSEFLNQIAILQAAIDGKKIAIYSPESYPKEDFVNTLIHTYLGKSTDINYTNVCSLEEYEKGIDFVDEHFIILDFDEDPEIDGLILMYEDLILTDGVDMFITDPYNSLDPGKFADANIAMSLRKSLTAMKRFAQKNMIVNIIVEHPKTPVKNADGSYPKASVYMLFGGTMWWNKMDVIVTLERDVNNDGDPTVNVNIQKVKNRKLNGRPGEIQMYFDIKTNRYYPRMENYMFLGHPMENDEDKTPEPIKKEWEDLDQGQYIDAFEFPGDSKAPF